jgi:hypothetical protein
LSSFIYVVEKCNTLAEINRTVDENIVPVGSAIIVNIIGVEEIKNKGHSINKVLLVTDK